MSKIPSTLSLVLCKNGTFITTEIPRKLHNLAHWRHPTLFPRGVKHETECALAIDGDVYVIHLFGGPENEAIAEEHHYENANLHELPLVFDTKLYFGNLLLVLAHHGHTFHFDQPRFQTFISATLDKQDSRHLRTSSHADNEWSLSYQDSYTDTSYHTSHNDNDSYNDSVSMGDMSSRQGQQEGVGYSYISGDDYDNGYGDGYGYGYDDSDINNDTDNDIDNPDHDVRYNCKTRQQRHRDDSYGYQMDVENSSFSEGDDDAHQPFGRFDRFDDTEALCELSRRSAIY